jgi:hypothetical protein
LVRERSIAGGMELSERGGIWNRRKYGYRIPDREQAMCPQQDKRFNWGQEMKQWEAMESRRS